MAIANWSDIGRKTNSFCRFNAQNPHFARVQKAEINALTAESEYRFAGEGLSTTEIRARFTCCSFAALFLGLQKKYI